jgi:hypothetical protein
MFGLFGNSLSGIEALRRVIVDYSRESRIAESFAILDNLATLPAAIRRPT